MGSSPHSPLAGAAFTQTHVTGLHLGANPAPSRWKLSSLIPGGPSASLFQLPFQAGGMPIFISIFNFFLARLPSALQALGRPGSLSHEHHRRPLIFQSLPWEAAPSSCSAYLGPCFDHAPQWGMQPRWPGCTRQCSFIPLPDTGATCRQQDHASENSIRLPRPGRGDSCCRSCGRSRNNWETSL